MRFATLICAFSAFLMSSSFSSAQQARPRVLVYTRTLGYRHDSIPTAIDVLRSNAGEYGIEFEFTEDPTQFTDANLSRFDSVMFVSTSEEVLDTTQQGALERYFKSGGIYTGVHSASACLYNSEAYLNAVGAYFDYHPDLQPATFLRLDLTHPATAPLPDRWSFTEEVYVFRSDPRAKGAMVLLTVDEASYNHTGVSTGKYPSEGDPHPIAWYIETPSYGVLAPGVPKAGRSFYTSLGHLNSTWTDPVFIKHVFGGLGWALDGKSTRAFGVGVVGNNGTASGASSSGGVGVGAASASGSARRTADAASGSGTASPSGGTGNVAGGGGGSAAPTSAPTTAAASSVGRPALGVAAAAGAAAAVAGLVIL